ncbi:CapA family protein [Bradyrhizobium sp. 188]|uniref:CapA family protein n=1 Tax=Bradyrhizobium sp. 188 TaxID=2782656 RepID=UPI001FFA061E|nr:CapA family protein [Bradyrhizobium sp. 188]MCK1496695.1 CapA family protein [Bradyrhizobium sp. 188]
MDKKNDNRLRDAGRDPLHAPGAYDYVGSTATNIVDGFTLVAVGDLIVTRALTKSQDADFGAVVELLREADVTFGNMETNIFDIREFTGAPQAEYGGAYHVSLPELGPDLRSMGFNLLSYANNHSLDWGVEGMRATCRVLDQNEIIYAGVGENLARAGAARFLETARGRVALISFASSFTPLSRACDAAGEAPGRPGLNALRLTRSVIVLPEMLQSLRQLRDALPDSKPGGQPTPAAVSGTTETQPHQSGDDSKLTDIIVAGVRYKSGLKPGYSFEPDSRDVVQILRNVRRGKQFSDFLVVTNHGHEPGNWSQEPPDYEQALAHTLIDAGADAYIVHGPHQLRGIEIYKGRPIFYSLGNFVMDDLRTPVGADMFSVHSKDPRSNTDAEVTVAEMKVGFSDPLYYESVITVSRFEKNKLAQLRLYPIELGFTKRFANRGIPRLAGASQAKAILDRLQRLSRPFGTTIAIENNIGLITVPAE